MSARWLVVADAAHAAPLRASLGADGRGVVCEADPWRARELLAGSLGGCAVMVGEGLSGPDAVNVAAALAADGHASEVVLAVDHASGSLRSRAKRAGISRVVTYEELAARDTPVVEGSKGASEDLPRSRAAEGDGPPRREGVPVLCLVSGRGGVGKTSVCALWGHIAAGWGMRVAALDLDLAFGNLHAVCGAERPGDLATLAGEGACTAAAIDALGARATELLGVWGPCAAPERAELVQPLAERIVSRLTCTHDLVLVDTTTNWGDAVACAAQMADRLVVVSDGRPGGMPALARCGSLAVRLGVARTRIVRLVNGCDARGRDGADVTRVAQGFEFAREIRVLDGGGEATELLASGHASELAATSGALVESLATGLAQLLKELGRLPDAEGAARALEGRKRPRGLLGRRREVA